MSETKNKLKILVADDSEMNRMILSDMLEDEFEILEAEDGVGAIALLQKYGVEISVVLLDIMMPHMDGFEVLEVMNRTRWIKDIPVIMISAENSAASIARAYEFGISDYISRPFDEAVVYRRVKNTIMLYVRQKKLASMVVDQIYEREKNSNLLILILSHIVEFRNGESGLHVLHIQRITEFLLRRLARKTDRYDLNNSNIIMISMAAALHDIGKIAIPEEILNKPGRLTPEEYTVMKTHSAIGARMMEELPMYQDEPLVKLAWQICRWHHERYDGRGYPDGLKGEEIPISAQVVSLADVYDALTSERVYKKAYARDVSLRMIQNGECGAFNPALVECLAESEEELWKEIKDSTPGKDSDREMQIAAEMMLGREELSGSEAAARQLENERLVNDFLVSVSEDIIFQYSCASSLLTLSPQAARLFETSEIVHTPSHCGLLRTEELCRVADAFRSATPEQPDVRTDLSFFLQGKMQHFKMIGKAIWSADKEPVIEIAIGKLIRIEDGEMAGSESGSGR